MNAYKTPGGAIAAIEIDSSRLLAQAYRKYDPADPAVQARKDAYLHTFVDDICAWGQRKSPQGGIGLMVMRDAFAETGAARVRRIARELHELYGADNPPSAQISDAEIIGTFRLEQYCPKGKQLVPWEKNICASIRKSYDSFCPEHVLTQQRLLFSIERCEKEIAVCEKELAAGTATQNEMDGLQEERAALKKRLEACKNWHEPQYVTKMATANNAEKKFFEERLCAGMENAFCSFAGYLGRGREYDANDRHGRYLWRDTNHLGSLTACYADLDCYRKGFAVPEQVAEYYLAEIDGKALPKCSAVVVSGQGAYVVWFFGLTDVRESETLEARHKAAELRIVALLEGLGADSASTDAARVLRIPGSVHHKEGRSPRPVYVYAAAPGEAGRCWAYPDAFAFFAALEQKTGSPLLELPTEEDFVQKPVAPEKGKAHQSAPATGTEVGEEAAEPADAAEKLNAVQQPPKTTARPKEKRLPQWVKVCEPELLPGPPAVLAPLCVPDEMPPEFSWLFDARVYRYTPGRSAFFFSDNAAHDMALLLLYFTPQVDYCSRNLAFFWLSAFLLAGHADDKEEVWQAVCCVRSRMEEPITMKELQHVYDSAQRRQNKIHPNRLIAALKIAPRTQPYLWGILYEAERERRVKLRRQGYEARRAPRSTRANEERKKRTAQKDEADIDKWWRAMADFCDEESGCTEREIAVRRGISKGTVGRLRLALSDYLDVTQTYEKTHRTPGGTLMVQDSDGVIESYEIFELPDAYAALRDKTIAAAAERTKLAPWKLRAALDAFETQDERLEAAEKQLQAELDAMAQAGIDTRKITQARPRMWIVRPDGTTEPYYDTG